VCYYDQSEALNCSLNMKKPILIFYIRNLYFCDLLKPVINKDFFESLSSWQFNADFQSKLSQNEVANRIGGKSLARNQNIRADQRSDWHWKRHLKMIKVLVSIGCRFNTFFVVPKWRLTKIVGSEKKFKVTKTSMRGC
jgi:hypothetical protein